MKTIFNRFALVPHMCYKCRNYFWLEKYRKTLIWDKYAEKFFNEPVCKDCTNKLVAVFPYDSCADYTRAAIKAVHEYNQYDKGERPMRLFCNGQELPVGYNEIVGGTKND